ncbi:NUDIX domain-containing protein [Amycolatopsis sp. NPDC023774]|uniref:NUDIX domain-containing protein n=1 Tax=Amycolatopsis sp. NPDC023774 TaxID=3155015 RepID=UPI0033FF755B
MSDNDVRYTADTVLIAPDEAGVPHVLLVTRAYAPFKGRRALPGGHVDDQDFAGTRDPRVASRNAAARETSEEAGVAVPPDTLRFLGTWDAPGRDPRGPYSTDAYVAELTSMPRPMAGDDASVAEWVPFDEALKELLAFDHNDIAAAANRR